MLEGDGFAVCDWSLADLASAFNRPVAECNRGVEAHNSPEAMAGYGSDWHAGITTRAQAEAIIERGWDEGAKRLAGLARDISPPTAKTRRRKPTWRDEGDELSIERAMAGEWDAAWRSSRRVWASGPSTVTLLTLWGGNAYCSADQLFWQGATAVVIADVLEDAGYSVRIVAGTPGRYYDGGNKIGVNLVTLKEETEPMRVDAVASVMCHAGVFRSLGFRAMMMMPFAVGGGLGSRLGSLNEVKPQLASVDRWPDGALVLGQTFSREACIQEIDRVIKQIETRE